MNSQRRSSQQNLGSLVTRSGLIGFLVALVVAVPAGADGLRSWASSSYPIVVTGYGSSGWGYGTFSETGGRMTLTATTRINDADNHEVYAHGRTQHSKGPCTAPNYTSCPSDPYKLGPAIVTPTNNSAVWRSHSNYGYPDAYSKYIRANQVFVKLDIPLLPDPQSSAHGSTLGIRWRQ